ncbi:DUF2250 domain-containing protein [Halocalculus aciditolerans]|nr:DUF2250 domain-containing protein [Halocalculus aciditolerans]
MSDAQQTNSGRLRSADRAILEFLQDNGAEYAAIIANRTGVHTSYAESRIAALAERGLIEPVTDEVVYRLTTEGRTALDPHDPRLS